MIASIEHKGLRLLWTKNDASRLPAGQVKKIRNILVLLHGAEKVEDLNYPGAGLHPLKGDLKGYWSVTVRGKIYLQMLQQKMPPVHPGEILKEMYLDTLGISITALADNLGVARKTVSQLVNGHMGVSAEMALRLGKAFNTTPELWLNMQRNYDLWQAGSKIKVTHIRSLRTKEQRAYKAN